MNFPKYESPIYDRALEIISTDSALLDAHDRTVRSLALAHRDKQNFLRDQFCDQLVLLLTDAIETAINEQNADDHGDDFYLDEE
ncbi:hypothetical protein [Limnobaculum xujianqingii]|uniref:hypothetical protein n=1 Tax=Limnobaculum xujianqingii TaxID=2738837 RepID=UPI00112BD76D|nr:hypothetical protein [Limnobaculum xujianqingii]